MNDSKSVRAMKSATFKLLFFSVFFSAISFGVSAQDYDGIYGDIYQAPKVDDEELLDKTESPLDGYSTVDDYYPEEGYTPANGSQQSYSERYVDENGNNVADSYYEDDNDYAYSSRIRRFHRNNSAWGYYDPWNTNMYFYNNDPFFWGTSIYAGGWPNYGWGWNNGWGGGGFGWNNGWNNGWGGGFGWNNGWNNGWGGGFGWNNGWNNGWGGGFGWNNGWNNGMGWNGGFGMPVCYGGGYYNTFDSNSGIYNGHRGSTGSAGNTIGTGSRNTTFGSVYNDAANAGKVDHANKGNVLQTADARPVRANVEMNNMRSGISQSDALRGNETNVNRGLSNDALKSEIGRERVNSQEPATRNNPYQRVESERSTSERATIPQRESIPSVDRSRYRATTTQPRTNSGTIPRPNTVERETSTTQPNRTSAEQRGNMYRDLQRTQPNTNSGYNRNNSNVYRQQPSRSGSNPQNGNQLSRPSNDQRYQQPSRNATPSREFSQPSRNATPSRNYQQPSRNATPSRSTQPSRSVSPSSSPSRGSSGGSFGSPSRSSGSGTPSRGSSSPSRGGRP